MMDTLNFAKLNTGLSLKPTVGSTVVTGLRFTTANDAPERDPATYTLEGTTGSPYTGPWTLISSGDTGMGGILMSNRLSVTPTVNVSLQFL